MTPRVLDLDREAVLFAYYSAERKEDEDGAVRMPSASRSSRLAFKVPSPLFRRS